MSEMSGTRVIGSNREAAGEHHPPIVESPTEEKPGIGPDNRPQEVTTPPEAQDLYINKPEEADGSQAQAGAGTQAEEGIAPQRRQGNGFQLHQRPW